MILFVCNFNKRRFINIFLIILLSTCSVFAGSDTFRIAVILDGPGKRTIGMEQLVKKEIADLTRDEFDVRFPDDKRIEGTWDAASVNRALDKALADPQVDIIITLGITASYEAVKRVEFSKPVIAPFIFDANIHGAPQKEGRSGIKKLNFINLPGAIQRDILAFSNLVDFENLGIIINKYNNEAVPRLVEPVFNTMAEMNKKATLIPVGTDLQNIFDSIPDDVDAVYLFPLVQVSDEDFRGLIKTLIDRKLPAFSLTGADEVRAGILATQRTDVLSRLARRIALNVQQIMIGKSAHKIPVNFSVGEELAINMRTASKIGVSPGWNMLIDAELIDEAPQETERVEDLISVINEAVRLNLDVAVQQRAVLAGEKEVTIATAQLLPQIDLAATGLIIDKDRAEASFGSQAQRSITGSASFRQILFSEALWANHSVQNHIQLSRVDELKRIKLDITLAAATAFLNYLRAQTVVEINKQNLKRSKSYLEAALIRESIGSAGPAEVYRWENEIATSRNDVIQAGALLNLVRLQLNRLLHKKLDEKFKAVETDIYANNILQSKTRVPRFLGSPAAIDHFKVFLVAEGLRASPELSALKQLIAAQERQRTSAGNRFWMPDLAVAGEYTHIISEAGAGSNGGLSGIPGLPAGSIPSADNTNWSLALNVSFPLFKGTEKFAVHAQAVERLEELRMQYRSLEEKIEQGIRANVISAGASYLGIIQANLAAEAAENTRKIVQDAYTRGAISILDLLDAENAALVSDRLSANAKYDFFTELMNVERTLGKFFIQMKREEAEAFLERLDAHFTQNGL